MLQRLLIITLTLCSLTASAQWQQTGSKVRYVNGLSIPTKDTAAGVAADSSQILIRPADSSLYIKYKRTWVKVGAGGGGTIGGSGTTNYVPKFTAGTTLGNSQIFDDGTKVGIGYGGVGAYKFGISYSQASNSLDGLVLNATTLTKSYTIWSANAISGGLYGLTNPFTGFINYTDAAATSYINDGTGYFSWHNSSAELMRLTNTGNVGIGTTSPIGRLSIVGSASSSGVLDFNTDTTRCEIQSYNKPLAINRQGNNVIFNEGGGGVGIGYTAPAAKLSVSGTTLINTNTDNVVDKLQVSGSAIASTLKVNTSGQTTTISNYYNGGTGQNIWIGGGGLSSTSVAEANTSLGFEALLANTSGYNNVAIGQKALTANNTGYANCAIGQGSLISNTSGYRNVSFGPASMVSNTTGFENMGIGTLALGTNSSGSKNVGIGSTSLYENTTGSSNIAFGFDAGRRISGGGANSTPSQSIYIGEDTRASVAGNTNEMVFGHTAIGQGSNTVTLGNSSITKTFLRGNTMVNTTTDNGVDELQVNGSISGIGFKQAYVTKTGAYTATDDDYVIDCTSGTFTVTLPASSGRTGRILIIKNSGAGTITVDGNGAETIDGAATYSLSVQYATIQIISDGTNWKIISKF